MPQKIISIPASMPIYDVVPLTIAYRENAVFKDTYGGAVGWVAVGGLY